MFDFGHESYKETPPAEIQSEDQSTVVEDVEIEEDISTNDTDDLGYTRIEYITVNASLNILPPGDPCILSYTFTAPQTGTYTFTFHEVEFIPSDIEDVPYEFKIYRADDASVNVLENMFSALEITVGDRCNFNLQRILLRFATKFNENGIPLSFTNEFYEDEIYKNFIVDILRKYDYDVIDSDVTTLNVKINVQVNIRVTQRGNAVSSAVDYKEIASVVEGVPYDNIFSPGMGFYADSGRSKSDNALEKFAVPTPKDGNNIPTDKRFYVTSISTAEEHDREQELQAMSNFALAQNAWEGCPVTSTNIRLGQISKTVVARYEAIEQKSRVVDISSLKFGEEAQEILDDGDSDYFRNEFGDYFASGYQWGFRYIVFIAVTAQNTTDLNTAVDYVETIMSRAGAGNVDQDTINKLIDMTNVYMEVQKITLLNDSTPQIDTGLGIQSVAENFSDFAQNAWKIEKDQYVKLKATLTRFREIPAANNVIPAKLPITTDHFNAIRDMTKLIFLTRCYFKALMSIPVNNLGNKLHQGWSDEFNTLIKTIQGQISSICQNENLVRDYKGQFDALCKKYQELIKHYIFFLRLIEAWNNQGRGFWNSKDGINQAYEWRLKTYSHSAVVQSDYYNGGKSLRVQEKYWRPVWHFGEEIAECPKWNIKCNQDNNGWRYCWLRVEHRNTPNSSGVGQSYPTLGSTSLHWFFESSTGHRAVWWGDAQIVYMPPDCYPFLGL